METSKLYINVVNPLAFDSNASPAPSHLGHCAPPPISFMSTTSYMSNMGESSLASTVAMAGDEYSFYRNWLREQVDKDPELAAQWQQWEAQGLISPKSSTPKPAAPWSQAGTPTAGSSTSYSSSAAASTQPSPHPHTPHKRTGPDLREQIARHLAASSNHTSSPSSTPASATAADPGTLPAAAAAAAAAAKALARRSTGSQQNSPRSTNNPRSTKESSAGGKSPPRKADLSRTQLKAVRKMFPIMTPSPKPAAALQGEYQLLDIIGKGAFGCAYKARHLPTARLVCIKTLETPAGQNQEEALARQKREVAVLAALALHPNIIRYHECFADSGKLQLVMEWADGGDLASVIERHAKAKTYMPEDQVLGYFVQLIAALAHVHGVGIMHRDIKTNNVFMTSQGLLKLGDFGISKVLDAPTSSSGSGNRTNSSSGTGGRTTSSSTGAVIHPTRGVWAHSFVGTPNYLAPEMVACEGYGFKADIWAAGCVLYEMAALKPAFRAKQISIIYHLIRRGKTSPLPSMYSKELQALQRRMMAKDPAERPSCADLMQEDILKPHLTRYYTLLRQLKMDLPRLPCDMAYGSHGSMSGALRTAALLTGRASNGGSPPSVSTRTSLDESWARLGFQKKRSRDSADYSMPASKACIQPNVRQQQVQQQQQIQQLQAALPAEQQQKLQQALAASSALFQSTKPVSPVPASPNRGSLDMPDITAALKAQQQRQAAGQPGMRDKPSRSTDSDGASSRTSKELQRSTAAAVAGTTQAPGPPSELPSSERSKSSKSSSGSGAEAEGTGLVSIGSGVVADVSGMNSGEDSPEESTLDNVIKGSSSNKTEAKAAISSAAAAEASGVQDLVTSSVVKKSVSLSGLVHSGHRPAPIKIHVLTQSPHSSAHSPVMPQLSQISSASNAISSGSSSLKDRQGSGLSGLSVTSSYIIPEVRLLTPEGSWVKEPPPSWQQQQQQQKQQKQKQQQGSSSGKGRHKRRESLLLTLHLSFAAMFGASGGASQRSRLGDKSLQASAFSEKLNKVQQQHKQQKQHEKQQLKQKQKAGKGAKLAPSNDSSAGSSSSSSRDGTIAAVRPADDAGGLYTQSWSDLLREAGITSGELAETALLQEAGELWESSRRGSAASSANNSQRSSLEAAAKLKSPGGASELLSPRKELQKSSLGFGSVQDCSVRSGRANKANTARSSRSTGEIIASPTGSSGSSGSSKGSPKSSLELSLPRPFRASSLMTWFGRLHQQRQAANSSHSGAGAAVSSGIAAAAAPATPSAGVPVAAADGSCSSGAMGAQQAQPQQQQQQQQDSGSTSAVIPSSPAQQVLSLATPPTTVVQLTQHLLQLRQLAATVGGTPGLFGSLSTITEGSESSRTASRRSSEVLVYSPNVQSTRCSLDVKGSTGSQTLATVPEQGSSPKVLSPLARPQRSFAAQDDGRLNPVEEFSIGTAAAEEAPDSSCQMDREDLMQREQLVALIAFQQLKALMLTPLPPGVQPYVG